jgi:membrane protease YdiL (CAAX protease family)
MPWDFWLIFFTLGVLLPWRGRMRMKKMMALPEFTARERIALYASTIAFQWTITAIAAWRAMARGMTLAELGAASPWRAGLLFVGIVGGVTLGGVQWLNLRRIGRSTGKPRSFLHDLAKRILPQSRQELIPYLALAVSAGICEEFLYRGFAMAALARAGMPVWSTVLLSAALFGLAHLYQGRGGLVSTLVIGTVFGAARIAYDSLLPVAIWHAAVDAVAGVAGPRYLVRTISGPVDGRPEAGKPEPGI